MYVLYRYFLVTVVKELWRVDECRKLVYQKQTDQQISQEPC